MDKQRKAEDYEHPEERLEGSEGVTGYCRFCGQSGIVYPIDGTQWGQVEIDEAVTCKCSCEEARKYAESKNRVEKAKKRIEELFGSKSESPVEYGVLSLILDSVDAIEAGTMKGITIEIGKGVKGKVFKMAKESIKVERSEVSKRTYEE